MRVRVGFWQVGMIHLTNDEGRYRLLVENIIDYAIYMLDTNGFVAGWNQGAERFKGYKATEIIGQHFSRFYTGARCHAKWRFDCAGCAP